METESEDQNIDIFGDETIDPPSNQEVAEFQ